MKWEYTVLYLGPMRGGVEHADKLNQFGEMGWELTGITQCMMAAEAPARMLPGALLCVFKRPKA